ATVSADIESLLAAGIPVKCGTPYILEEQANGVAKIAAFYRTSGMQHFALSAEGHFRVHYNTTGIDTVDVTDLSGNGVPDYVDSALVYLEYAYDLIVDGLRFDPPLPDGDLGGGPETDVYLRNLSGVYGQTFSVLSMRDGNSSPAYFEVDNDFSESIYASNGLDALKVTTAHEFFHAVQFRLYCNLDLNWWQEHSAVWMEDYVWDEVNDYFAYLKYFFTYQNIASDGKIIWDARNMPLDSRNGTFEYGAAIWAFYLAKRFDPGIIKTIWDNQAAIGSHSINDFEGSIPGGLMLELKCRDGWLGGYCRGIQNRFGRVSGEHSTDSLRARSR
ncbi:MXAN_6640 family putative metalloprotease, partial [Candidatus Latescibacterota bacterium]